nr:MFS transporter [Dactylosporangium thailandense]
MRRGLIGLLAVACGLTAANLYYAQPLLPVLGDTFGVGDVTVSTIVVATQIAYAIGLFFLGPLGDRVQVRTLVTVLLLAGAAGLTGAAAAPAFGVLLAASVVVGAVSVVAQILVPFAAGLATDADRGRVTGTVMSGLLAGILLARAFSGVVSDTLGWRWVYALSAAFMLGLAAALRAMLPVREPSTTAGYGHLLRSTLALPLRHPTLRRRGLFQAALFGSFTAFWTTMGFLLTRAPYHLSELHVGLFSLLGAGGALIAPAAGRWSDRGWSRRSTVAGLLVAGVAFAAAGAVTALPGRIAGIVALAVAALVIDAAVQTLLITNQQVVYRLEPSARARINTVFLVTFFLGGAAGAQLSTVAWHLGGWPAVAGFGGALPLLALLTYLAGGLRKERAEDAARAEAQVPVAA